MGRLSPVRVVAALTVIYSAAITVVPKLLVGPSQMLDEHGDVLANIAALVRSTTIGTPPPSRGPWCPGGGRLWRCWPTSAPARARPAPSRR